MELDVTPEDLARTTLFRSVDVTAILDRLRTCERRQLRAGETLITQGAPNRSVFVVMRGHLFVRLTLADQFGISVAVIGDCVGEMSVIDGRPATATVIAEVDSAVLVLPRELIWTLIDHTTLLSRNLLYILAGRLRLGDHLISVGQDEHARNQRFATQDLLTTLRNRRWFDAELPRLVGEAGLRGTPLALVLCEIDRLDDVNDAHGRAAGDTVIERVALAVSQAVPDSTQAVRYGGSTFAVLLAGYAYLQGFKVSEAIRHVVAAMPPLAHHGHLLPPAAVTVGLACLEHGMTSGALEEHALADMHRARAARAG